MATTTDHPDHHHYLSMSWGISGYLAGSASKKFTVFRLLPQMIASQISSYDAWKVYLLLREIGDIIMAPTIKMSWVPYLEEKIIEFHLRFQEVFPNKNTQNALSDPLPLTADSISISYPSVMYALWSQTSVLQDNCTNVNFNQSRPVVLIAIMALCNVTLCVWKRIFH